MPLTQFVLVFIANMNASVQVPIIVPNLDSYAECKRVEMILKKELVQSSKVQSYSNCIEVLK